MRKLYNHNKGKIHPSSPPSTTITTTTDHLSLLPLAVATLAAALAPEDQEVLAYLLSCTTTEKKLYGNNTKSTDKTGSATHAPNFNCYCFSCYTSYWARWDASPRRDLIHEVIDTYEAISPTNNNKKNGKNKNKKKNKVLSPSSSSPHARAVQTVSRVPLLVEETRINNMDCVDDEDGLIVGMSSGEKEKGSIKKIVSFIGERIWGVWGI